MHDSESGLTFHSGPRGLGLTVATVPVGTAPAPTCPPPAPACRIWTGDSMAVEP